jgi:hypothetical protein
VTTPDPMESWTAAVRAELGLADDPQVRLVLAVAKDVAHGVLRPGAPVTAYLMGVAVGRGADPADVAARLSALAERHGSEAPPAGA